MFVTPSDFIDVPYNLPKMTDPDTMSIMSKFITRLEQNNLRRILGSDFYEAFMTALAALPPAWDKTVNYVVGNQVSLNFDSYVALQNNINVSPDSDPAKWQVQPRNKWQKLALGEVYQDKNGIKENWSGMKELLKPLIYSRWLGDWIDTQVQPSGVIQQQSENATNVTSAIRVADSYQSFSLMVGKLDSQEVDTLYNYLCTNSANFNDVVQNISSLSGSFDNYLASYFINPGFINDFDF